MITAIRSQAIVLPEGLLEGYVYIQDGKILEVTASQRPYDKLLDLGSLYVSPGFIDQHTHGGFGVSFLNCNAKEAQDCCLFHMKHGTTTILPTLAAAPMAEMEAATAVIAELMAQPDLPVSVPGVHMEGPYFSPAQCGGQKAGVLTEPIPEDYIPFLQRWGKYIARWSYAPELDREQAFCRHILEKGILASAGHTNARYEEFLPAVKAGCNLVTHLYSCTSTVTREQGFRHLGVIETAYLLPDLDVEIIADGKHLPPELIQMIVGIKGKEHVLLCTDSLAAAGLDTAAADGSYLIEDGVCKLPDRSAFAGSIATTDRLVRVLVKDCGISVSDAVYMMCTTPARLLGLPKGRLQAGLDADIVAFDGDIQIKTVITKGIQRI